MRAELVIEVDGEPVLGSRVVGLRGTPPLTAKVLQGPRASPVVVLVGSAAGVLEGDNLAIRLCLTPGARLTVASVAATVAHPCPGSGAGSLTVDVELGAGARLDWCPEPVVSCAGSRFATTTRVRLDQGAVVRWQEEVVLGRSGESAGSLRTSLVADLGGRPLLRDGLDTDMPGFEGPAGVGTARYVGAVHLLGARPCVPAPGVFELAGEGATARVLTADAASGRAVLASISSMMSGTGGGAGSSHAL